MKRFSLIFSSLLLIGACSEKSIEEQLQETSINLGGDTGSIGTNVSRPAWLPRQLELPEELIIQIASYDQALGEGMVHGVIDSAPVSALIKTQKSMLESAGYTVSEDPGRQGPGLGATHDDGTYVAVGTAVSPSNSITYQMTYFAKHSDDAIRAQAKANAYDGKGMLTLVVGDDTHEIEGNCRIHGTLAEFNSDDGTTSISASAAGAVPSFTGNIAITHGEMPKMYTPVPSGSAGQKPVSAVTEGGFSYSGRMTEFGVGSMTETAGTLMMRCERL